MEEEQPKAKNITGIALAVEGSLALAAVAVGLLVGHSPLRTIPVDGLSWSAVGRDVGVGLAATVPLILGMLLIDRWPIGPLSHLKQVVQELVVPLFKGVSTFELALISLVAGIGEEMLFRGLLQDGLAAWIGGARGVWIAVLAASLVFGLAHSITKTYVVLAALAGAYLGLLFWATDSLVAPIVAHGAYDFLALFYLVRRSK
jgi:hypothetical protein